ncbi:hypothetical protein B0H13DRAFT_1643800, partial [Mycena leptocephala]
MPDTPLQQTHGGKQLRIWGQNLNRSLKAQTDFINSLSPHHFDFALVQEPCCDFRGLSRTTRAFVSIYPPTHAQDQRATRSMIMVNARIPSTTWNPVIIQSPDVTAVEIFGANFGTIRIINVYNNCNHNQAL